METPELSIILPCRNEEQALPTCLKQIKKVISQHKINAEIIVSDSSTDKSPEIARQYNVKLIKHNKKGYGIAYLEAFKQAKGKYIFMADADCTYDFNEIPNFLKYLKQDYDFVIGNRFAYNLEKNTMPLTHKYIGNPILSGILRLFFSAKVNDSHCGMRAITRKALDKLHLQTTGMEFASEMVIKVVKNKLKIKQIPIKYHPRKGDSKLNPFIDAWRHLRFMLLYCPLWLFFIPGLFFFLVGIISLTILSFGNFQIFGLTFYYHPLFISSLLTILGYQLMIFALFSKTYAITHLEDKPIFEKFYKYITIENSSILGGILIITGILIYIFVLTKWIKSGFSPLNEVKNSIIAFSLIIIGLQTIFSSFMLSILGIKKH